MSESLGELHKSVFVVETLRIDDELSSARISLRGLNRRTINHNSTTLYHVTAGQGRMNVGGKVYELKPGSIVEVSPNTPYFDEGNVDMDIVSIPPFNLDDVEEVDF